MNTPATPFHQPPSLVSLDDAELELRYPHGDVIAEVERRRRCRSRRTEPEAIAAE